MTTNLKRKLTQLNKLLSERHADLAKLEKLKKDIDALVLEQSDLPKKGSEVWCWHRDILYHGSVERVTWKPALQRFRVGVRTDKGALIWKEVDRVWTTERDAKRWDLENAVRKATHDLEAAKKRLADLQQEMDAL